MLSTLRIGECILRQSQSAYPHALLAIVDLVPPFRGATTRCDTHPFVAAASLKQLPELEELIKRRKAEFWQSRRRQKQTAGEEISNDAHTLLMLIVLHPAVPVVQLLKKLDKKLSFGKQAAIRQELEQATYAEFDEERVGKFNLLLPEAREEGAQRVGKRYVPIPGRGKRPHRTYAAWLMMLAGKQGIRARREFVVGATTHPVDVAHEEAEGRWHAFEIIATPSGVNIIADHLRACLLQSNMITRVTIVIPLLSMKAELSAIIDADRQLDAVRDRIAFQTVTEIYEELWPSS